MSTQAEMLQKLITAAYEGPVFGRGVSFAPETVERLPVIQAQIVAIADICNKELYATVQTGMPEYDELNIKRLLGEIAPKSVSFCPALAAGELTGDDNTRRLAGAAGAIGTMYFADQTMDRGDEAMVLAIERLCGQSPVVPANLEDAVTARLLALQDMKKHIDSFALPEDAPYVLECYDEQVLKNEVGLHRLSADYLECTADEQETFLGTHGAEAANFMVADAGLPSVSAALYSIYRANDSSLPPLSAVHGDSMMRLLLQTCNAVARIGDEVGDWQVDAGQDKDWGVFSINPFNQYHPKFIARLCELAGITDSSMVDSLQHSFKNFHNSDAMREQYTREIPAVFFAHARETFEKLPQEFIKKYGLYINLCRRVLEISQVNMMGDRALAGRN